MSAFIDRVSTLKMTFLTKKPPSPEDYRYICKKIVGQGDVDADRTAVNLLKLEVSREGLL